MTTGADFLNIYSDLRLKLRSETTRNIQLTAEVDILRSEARWSFRWGVAFGMVAGAMAALLTVGILERLH